FRALVLAGGPMMLGQVAEMSRAFSDLSESEKVDRCIELLSAHAEQKRMIVIQSYGAQREEDGRYVDWLRGILKRLPASPWPLVALIQTRRVTADDRIEIPLL